MKKIKTTKTLELKTAKIKYATTIIALMTATIVFLNTAIHAIVEILLKVG